MYTIPPKKMVIINILDILKKLNSYDTLEVSNDDIKAGISKSESDQGFFLTEEQKELRQLEKHSRPAYRLLNYHWHFA